MSEADDGDSRVDNPWRSPLAEALRPHAQSLAEFFGAKAAAEAALRLEMLGQAGTWAGAEEAWSLLEREIQHLRPALGGFSGK